MSQFKAITAALDMLGFPGASLDAWKSRSDREGEEERYDCRVCGPCERQDHENCWHKPGHYKCTCAICRGVLWIPK